VRRQNRSTQRSRSPEGGEREGGRADIFLPLSLFDGEEFKRGRFQGNATTARVDRPLGAMGISMGISHLH
jgi:hypothetical protein